MCKLTFKSRRTQLRRAALSATTHPTPHHWLSLPALIRRAAWLWGIGRCGGRGALSSPPCTSCEGRVTGGERCSQSGRLRLPVWARRRRSVRGLRQPQSERQFENKLRGSLIMIIVVIPVWGTLNSGKNTSVWWKTKTKEKTFIPPRVFWARQAAAQPRHQVARGAAKCKVEKNTTEWIKQQILHDAGSHCNAR